MQKIVIDTNVLVSGIIQQGYPYLILNNLFIEDKITLCISDELMAEYYEVLNRKKFSKYKDFLIKAELLLTSIEKNANHYFPKIKLKIIKDENDNKLLELAEECKADYLITGNTNDFTISKYKRTKIVTPTDYYQNYSPK